MLDHFQVSARSVCMVVVVMLAGCGDPRYSEDEYIKQGCTWGIVINVETISVNELKNTSDKVALIRYGAEGFCEVVFKDKTAEWYVSHGVKSGGTLKLP